MSITSNKNVSRFYSLALGKYKNFQAKTDGLVNEALATPDVSLNSLIYTNNSSTIVITNLTNGCEGQLVTIINVGSDLSFNGSNFQLTDSSNMAKNDNISFINHSNVWYETGRSHSGALDTIAVAHGNSAPSVKNLAVLIFNGSAAQTLIGLSDGSIGQTLWIYNNGPSAISINTSALIANSAGGVFLLSSGLAINAVYIAGRFRGTTHASTP